MWCCSPPKMQPSVDKRRSRQHDQPQPQFQTLHLSPVVPPINSKPLACSSMLLARRNSDFPSSDNTALRPSINLALKKHPIGLLHFLNFTNQRGVSLFTVCRCLNTACAVNSVKGLPLAIQVVFNLIGLNLRQLITILWTFLSASYRYIYSNRQSPLRFAKMTMRPSAIPSNCLEK